ncbi:Ig-like domain-containing protein [Streptomyces boninensis]|uniref:L,D-transpeptidase n=1 Tax=Streptomyces boninensis TaxID=2039455 RepID=UPI003B219F3E
MSKELPRRRRTALSSAAAVVLAAMALTACGGGDSDAKGKSTNDVDDAAAKNASQADISISPKEGADNVGINRDTKVTVKGGKLTQVTLKDTETGKLVEGTIASGGKSWKPDGQLERATDYEITAKAKDSEGRNSTEHAAFTTVSPKNSFIGSFQNNMEGETVGVGMYPSIQFDKPIKNKAAVEKKITANASTGEKFVGHWFGDQRFDLRPQNYFKSGTKVTLKLDLDGVEGSPGVYGVQDRTVNYTIGSEMVSTVDVKTKKMTVTENGKVIKTVPISAGSPENPTYNGKMVVSEMYKETRMDGSTVGFTDDDGKGEYDIPDVPHAMRLSQSGTFIHGNYWGKGIFGSANTSHGCVGLADVKGAGDSGTPGAWFYGKSKVGDIVEVKNSPDKDIQADNGLSGWNMSWSEWTAGSAIR